MGLAFKYTSNGYVSLKRVQVIKFLFLGLVSNIFNLFLQKKKKFLLRDEMKIDENNLAYSDTPMIHLENFSGYWNQKNDEFHLKNINLKVENGELIAIAGLFGSGKVIYYIP